MKSNRFLLPMTLAWAFSPMGGNAAEILFRVTNAPSSGTLVVEVYDSPTAFGDLRDPVRSERFDLGEAEPIQLTGLPPGEYAVAMYFDENANGRLDRNFLRIPREPVGFSNGYRPKGPPSYRKAAFQLDESGQSFDVKLERPLGERGRIGVGLGAIVRSTPYKGSSSTDVQPIPAVTYIGNRIQIFGPAFQVGVVTIDDLQLALRFSYRFGAYEEDDSTSLNGLGDREDTLMGGLALQYELPEGFELGLSYEHDLLDEFGGGYGALTLDRSFQLGRFRVTPEIGVQWQGSATTREDYGVPAEAATVDRPAYRPGEAFNPSVGANIFLEVTRDIQWILSTTVEWLDDEITASPIVDEDILITSFTAVVYTF